MDKSVISIVVKDESTGKVLTEANINKGMWQNRLPKTRESLFDKAVDLVKKNLQFKNEL